MAGTLKYNEKLKDPRWQRKRLEVFQRDSFKCRCCKSEEKTLSVHHLCYIKGFEPWDYDLLLFLTVCGDCHTVFGENPWMSEYFLIEQIKEKASKEFKKTFDSITRNKRKKTNRRKNAIR